MRQRRRLPTPDWQCRHAGGRRRAAGRARGGVRCGHLPRRSDLGFSTSRPRSAASGALRPGGRLSAIVYSTAERNPFFAVPVGIIRRRAQRHRPPRDSRGRSVSAGLVSPRRRWPALASTTSPWRPYPRRCACPAPPNACGSSASRSERCTRCSPACRNARRRGPRSPPRLAAYEGTDGFVGPCEMLVVTGTGRRAARSAAALSYEPHAITTEWMIVSDELAAGVRRMLADAHQRGLAVESGRPVAHSLEGSSRAAPALPHPT